MRVVAFIASKFRSVSVSLEAGEGGITEQEVRDRIEEALNQQPARPDLSGNYPSPLAGLSLSLHSPPIEVESRQDQATITISDQNLFQSFPDSPLAPLKICSQVGQLIRTPRFPVFTQFLRAEQLVAIQTDPRLPHQTADLRVDGEEQNILPAYRREQRHRFVQPPLRLPQDFREQVHAYHSQTRKEQGSPDF